MSPSTSRSGASSRPCSSLRSSRSQPANARCAAWRSAAATHADRDVAAAAHDRLERRRAERLGQLLARRRSTTSTGRSGVRSARAPAGGARRRRTRSAPRRPSAQPLELGQRRPPRREQVQLELRASTRAATRTSVASAVERPLRYGPVTRKWRSARSTHDRLELGVAEPDGCGPPRPRAGRGRRARPASAAARSRGTAAARRMRAPRARATSRREVAVPGDLELEPVRAGSRDPAGSCAPRTTLSGTPSAANSSSSAMRSTSFAGTMPASAFGTAPRRSAVIAKCTPSGRPSPTSRGSASTSAPRLTRSNAAAKPA